MDNLEAGVIFISPTNDTFVLHDPGTVSEAVETKATNELSDNVVMKIDSAKEQINPLDQAAHMFMTSLPRIRALSGNMSRNALARVYKAVVEFPLAEDYPKFRNKVENELFILTLATIDAKNMMTSSFGNDVKKEITEEATNGIVQEILAENVKEKKEEDNV